MPTSPKTFRVFVSSTFADLRAERRVLQEWVFPDLKRYCETRPFRVIAMKNLGGN